MNLNGGVWNWWILCIKDTNKEVVECRTGYLYFGVYPTWKKGHLKQLKILLTNENSLLFVCQKDSTKSGVLLKDRRLSYL